MLEVRQTAAFERWLRDVRDIQAKARINARLRRISLGVVGDVKSVGGGVSEIRIDHGPGYRLYFVRRGDSVLILLCAATKADRTGISGEPGASPRR